jgi:phosphatidylinositol-3-phosphatase
MLRARTHLRLRLGVFLLLVLIGLAGCGGGGSMQPKSTPTPTPTPAPSPSPTPALPTADHVFLVVLENHSFSSVIGNPVMPYFNALVAGHSLAANYFANAHQSIADYFMLTTGQMESSDNTFSGAVADDNIVRAISGAGKSWKAYMESLPAAGYTGNDVYPYVKHHNPFSYLTDVLNTSAQAANIVPLTQLALDLSSRTLPAFAFIVPNIENDAHDCPQGGLNCADPPKLAAADNWLRSNIDPLINSPAFANSVLIITWDEGDITDVANGGGQVATVLVGVRVKTAFQSPTFYQHQSTLRLILDLLQVSDHPGASNGAPEMQDFFQ